MKLLPSLPFSVCFCVLASLASLPGSVAAEEQLSARVLQGEATLRFSAAERDTASWNTERWNTGNWRKERAHAPLAFCYLSGEYFFVSLEGAALMLHRSDGSTLLPTSDDELNAAAKWQHSCARIKDAATDSILLWSAKRAELRILDYQQEANSFKTRVWQSPDLLSENTELLHVHDHTLAVFDRNTGGLTLLSIQPDTKRLKTLGSLGDWTAYSQLLGAQHSVFSSVSDIYLFDSNSSAVLQVGYQQTTYERRYAKRPLHTSYFGSPEVPTLGDFNGDGFIDVLLARPAPMGWTALAGGDLGLVPVSVLGLAAQMDVVGVFDVNADGQDDLLVRESNEGFRLLLSSSSRMLSEIQEPIASMNELPAKAPTRIAELMEDRATHFRHLSKVYRRGSGYGINIFEYPREGFRGQPIDFGARLNDRLPGPFACSGYNPDMVQLFGRTRLCPEHYAFFALDDGGGKGAHGEIVNHHGLCCRLPADDVIDRSKALLLEARSCPPEHIVVGLEPDHASETEQVVCAPLNTTRYQLAASSPGRYWGIGASQLGDGKNLEFHQVPPAMRLGLRRDRRNVVDIDGCVASTPGGLLTRRSHTKRCEDAGFATLLDRNTKQPVEMFFPCSNEADPFQPSRGCDPEPQHRAIGSAMPAPASLR